MGTARQSWDDQSRVGMSRTTTRASDGFVTVVRLHAGGAKCPRRRLVHKRAVIRNADDGRRRYCGLRLFHGSDRKSIRLNSSHQIISYAVFCLKKKTPCDTPTANKADTI